MGITVHHGDSREVLKTFPDNHFSAVVCDPPYALVSIGKRFGAPNAKLPNGGSPTANVYNRTARGFMGSTWDTGQTAFDPDFWAEVMRVLKPGGHLVALGGTRTYHRLACAIEDAGFDIRDTLTWNFGSGFPKSHDVKKGAGAAVCRCAAGDDKLRGMREAPDDAGGVGAASETPDLLSPVQRSPEREGVGHSWPQGTEGQDARELCIRGDEGAEESSVEGRRDLSSPTWELCERQICEVSAAPSVDGEGGRVSDGTPFGDGRMGGPSAYTQRDGPPQGSPAAEQSESEPGTLAGQSESQISGAWPLCGGCGKPIILDGLGTALKPAMELICLARKPLSERTIAANILKWGTGALNIEASRIKAALGDYDHPGDLTQRLMGSNGGAGRDPSAMKVTQAPPNKNGRWPANVAHDGSAEVLDAFPFDASVPGQAGRPVLKGSSESDRNGNQGGALGKESRPEGTITGYSRGDSGSAARFFYSAKADAEDRLGSKHPTVKPVDLMRWLCTMITPPGGIILDPFAGTGTTGLAAHTAGFDCVLIEREAAFVDDINRRLAWARGEGKLYAQEIAHHPAPPPLGGLFEGMDE